MVRNALIIALGSFIALAATTGCSREKQSAPATAEGEAKDTTPPSSSTEAPKQAGQEHASEGAVPGSHEDWCAEHQVPESQCTRCDPGLIAAFKATGDWCEEHGLPQSQCLKCNPDLKIVRPPPGAAARGK